MLRYVSLILLATATAWSATPEDQARAVLAQWKAAWEAKDVDAASRITPAHKRLRYHHDRASGWETRSLLHSRIIPETAQRAFLGDRCDNLERHYARYFYV
jgi:hypothetical protein